MSGYVLACTHVAHLEPVVLGVLMRRRIDWMTRIEFFRYAFARWLLRAIDAFPVKRSGVPAKALRTAITRARAGRIVGIFPEGGTTSYEAAACRGGPLKHGAAFIACAAGVPILPCLIVGTDRLSRVLAWIPWRRESVQVLFGSPIAPDPLLTGRANAKSRRQAREQMTRQLQAMYIALDAQAQLKSPSAGKHQAQ